MSLTSGTLGTHGHTSEAESHETRGDARALLHWEAGLQPQDTWRHQSSSLSGGGPDGTEHMATLEPSHIRRQVWSRGTCDDTGALPCWAAGRVTRGDARALPHWEVGLEPQETWRHRSPSLPGGGPSGTWRHKSPPTSRGGSRAMGHVATPEPFPIGWRAWCHGAHSDARAL
jgi:hypothetical protein